MPNPDTVARSHNTSHTPNTFAKTHLYEPIGDKSLLQHTKTTQEKEQQQHGTKAIYRLDVTRGTRPGKTPNTRGIAHTQCTKLLIRE